MVICLRQLRIKYKYLIIFSNMNEEVNVKEDVADSNESASMQIAEAVIDAATTAAVNVLQSETIEDVTVLNKNNPEVFRKILIRFCFIAVLILLTEAMLVLQQYFAIPTSEGYDRNIINRIITALYNNNDLSSNLIVGNIHDTTI